MPEIGPISGLDIKFSDRGIFEKFGIEKNQKLNGESIEPNWEAGNDLFISMFESGTLSCPGPPHIQSVGENVVILSDCICPPNCGGGGLPDPDPDPGDPIQISAGSEVSTFEAAYAVSMASWSWASEPIYFIDVIGSSYRSGVLLTDLWDGGHNRANAAVSLSATKQMYTSEHWQQSGNHMFSDEEFGDDGGGTVILWTFDDANF